ncbi:MAG: hypothetical protein RLZZ124_908 [Cyanobacteriota bacterium]|jgi:hypothetical protein
MRFRPTTGQATSGLRLALPLLGLPLLLQGCDPLPKRMPRDPPGTAVNASTAYWSGRSSTGAYGIVRQVTTAPNRFSFKETWFRGKGSGPVVTLGKGTYEPSTGINIYEYSQPAGVVVVRTREGDDAMQTEDTVLATTMPLFRVGETITYTLKP